MTPDERRHQETQDELTHQRRAAEERAGHRVDLIADGNWISGT